MPWCGIVSSSTMMVMRMAMTPSLKASRRLRVMAAWYPVREAGQPAANGESLR